MKKAGSRKRIGFSLKFRPFDLFLYLFFVGIGFITLYPFWDVLVGSLEPYKYYVMRALHLFPKEFTLEAYSTFLMFGWFFRSLGNTLFIVLVGTLLSVFFSSVSAYALSRPTLRGRNVMMYLLTFTMLFNGGMMATFVVLRDLKLLDTLMGVILLQMINTYYLIVMKSYYSRFPESILEAARIDGASHFVTYFRIVLPESMPIIATMILFYSADKWNDLWTPLIYLLDGDKKPLSVMLYEILSEPDVTSSSTAAGAASLALTTPQSQKMAAVITSSLPILIAYPFLQKYFAKGVTLGSVKG